MPFINTPLPLESLPAAEAVELEPIQPDYRKVLRLEWLITNAILLAIAIAWLIAYPRIRTLLGASLLLGGVILFALIYFLLQELGFRYRAMAIREHDLLYQRGWFVRKLKVCPFNRVQNCSLQSGLLERRYGLATVTLYTAGADGADLKLPGLLQEEAEKLRDFILSRIHKEEHETL